MRVEAGGSVRQSQWGRQGGGTGGDASEGSASLHHHAQR